MDGLLVIDKPSGPTSHDVVARLRRCLQERRIGHTGTLDPLATGVLPLVIGRATRLARFMSKSDKRYRAVVRLGVRTDSADADGQPIGDRYAGPLPTRDRIEEALDTFRGSFEQHPPVFSAKKIAGRRSYALARASRGQTPGSDPGVRSGGQTPGSDLGVRSGGQIRGSDPGVRSCSQIAGQDAEVAGGNPRPRAVTVTIHGLTLIDVDRDLLILDIHCSAGFYVRALADDLGERLGTGAHLTALRRTQSGEFTLEDAMPLDVAENNPTAAARRVIPLAGLLTTLNAVKLTHEGVRFAAHGREIGPAACEGIVPLSSAYVRLLDPSGDLIGVGVPSATPGLLHPSVVLM